MKFGKRLKIEEITILLKDNVHIRNKDHVEQLINDLVDGGKEKLQVISDFDQTLTKQQVDGQRCLTSFGIFSECKQLPSDYKSSSHKLYNFYRPIEIDPNISKEEKTHHMLQWYMEAQNLLKGFDFHQDEIHNAVASIGSPLRDGSQKMFQKLKDADVPVLVFSAGLGDVVSSVLQHNEVLYSNVHVISNFLKFDGPKLDGFDGNLIHAFNKNEHAVKNSDYFKVLRTHTNVLLMGDVIGDADMAEGVEDSGTILKIGFLYDRVDECLEAYLDHFDIVLVDDQTMDVANELLELIL